MSEIFAATAQVVTDLGTGTAFRIGIGPLASRCAGISVASDAGAFPRAALSMGTKTTWSEARKATACAISSG